MDELEKKLGAYMNYEKVDVFLYLQGVSDVLRHSFRTSDPEAGEKVKSNEFAKLCRDLMLSFQSHVNLTCEEQLEKFAGAGYEIGADRIAEGYLFAIGVVAASPFLPEKTDALAYIGKMLGSKYHRELFPVVEQAHRHLIKMDSHRLYSILGESNQFGDAQAGELMLTELTTLFGSGRHYEVNYIKHFLPEFSEFFEKYEKTRSYSPVWEKAAPWINDIYTRISEDPSIGRKNPDVAKVLRLTKDGADLVSVSDCVEATKKLFLGLVHPERSDCDEFVKNLDILDDHSSFYSVAFQSELLGNLSRGDGIQRELTRWPRETRDSFRKNLAALAQRIEGKVADSGIVLCTLLLGNSVVDSMTLKDRAQGKPKWLESAILDNAENPRHLVDPNSAISIVMDTLLSRYAPDEASAFWKENTGGDRYIAEEYRRPNLFDDNGYGR
jgi:hypothetical protein